MLQQKADYLQAPYRDICDLTLNKLVGGELQSKAKKVERRGEFEEVWRLKGYIKNLRGLWKSKFFNKFNPSWSENKKK